MRRERPDDDQCIDEAGSACFAGGLIVTSTGSDSNLRALVAGGAGFLGSHLCDRLLADGYQVVCIDDFSTGSLNNVAHLVDEQRFTVIKHDVTIPLVLHGSVTHLYHFASPASPIDYLQRPIETLRAGSVGTLNLLELARQKQARFVLASTSEIYGDPSQHPQAECYHGNVDPIGPRSPYDEAKRFSEAAAFAYGRRHSIDIAVARIFNTYGPRMRPDDGRVVPTFIRQALGGSAVTVAGAGTQTRSFCYVTDMVEGITALANSDHAGPVNLGSEEELTILDLARMILQETGSASPIVHIPRPDGDPGRRRPDTSRARRLLHWLPAVQVQDGIRETIRPFQEAGLTRSRAS
jgi:dTDP-glucose 4,6-dehydratase